MLREVFSSVNFRVVNKAFLTECFIASERLLSYVVRVLLFKIFHIILEKLYAQFLLFFAPTFEESAEYLCFVKFFILSIFDLLTKSF